MCDTSTPKRAIHEPPDSCSPRHLQPALAHSPRPSLRIAQQQTGCVRAIHPLAAGREDWQSSLSQPAMDATVVRQIVSLPIAYSRGDAAAV